MNINQIEINIIHTRRLEGELKIVFDTGSEKLRRSTPKIRYGEKNDLQFPQIFYRLLLPASTTLQEFLPQSLHFSRSCTTSFQFCTPR